MDILKRDEATTALEALVKKLNAITKKAEDSEMLALAKKYELLDGDSAALAETLKKIKTLGDETFNRTLQTLDAALAAQSKLFAEVGKSGETPGDDLESMAARIQKSEGLSRRKALDKAWQLKSKEESI